MLQSSLRRCLDPPRLPLATAAPRSCCAMMCTHLSRTPASALAHKHARAHTPAHTHAHTRTHTQTHEPTHPPTHSKNVVQCVRDQFVSAPKTADSVRAQLWQRVRQMYMADKIEEASDVDKTILGNLRALAEVSTVAARECMRLNVHIHSDPCTPHTRPKPTHLHRPACARAHTHALTHAHQHTAAGGCTHGNSFWRPDQ